MAKKKNQPWAEGGYDDWGRYMDVKKAKLEEQFQEEAETEFPETSSIFQGVAIFVNGYTNPTSDVLRRLMMAHGGIFHHYLRPQITTHLIASNLPYSKIMMYKKARNPLPLCKPEWITDSIKARNLLDYRNYLLYSQHTKTQPQLARMFQKPEDKPSTSALSTKNPEFLSEFYSNSRLHHISTMGATFKDYVNDLRSKGDGKCPGRDRLRALGKLQKPGPSTRHDSDSEEDFSPGASKSNPEIVIMHIDMDCFFVSVGLRNQPELRGFPVAVAHAKGQKEQGSMSEVASCSYEARKRGVKNGMFLGQALKLCPDLKTISYDFEGYKEVSYALYDTVASYTLDIEAVSCDEMYVDCTRLFAESNFSAAEFAEVLRREIKEKTGCPVSTGFGGNKLCARLATRKAKPDGQFHLKNEDAVSYIGTLVVRDLPSVGSTTAHKLKQMNAITCGDLQAIPLSNLQNEFGKKTGEMLYNMCRGVDHSKVNLEHVRKSVSAEVNYGIRFEGAPEATKFLEQLSSEVCSRLKKAKAKGRCVTLKLMVRAKEAPKETAKFMGHGLCDCFTRSNNLVAPVDDVSIITKEVLTLWNQLRQTPDDVRGIGIQISRLEPVKSKNASSKLMDFIKTKNPTVVPETMTEDFVEETANNEGSSKKVQKKQKDYFKETKSTMFRSGKIQAPTLQEIDMSVLVELPEDIRNEILDEYKINKNARVEPMIPGSSKNVSNEQMLTFSQVDPEFLAALPEDVKNEVKMYCQSMKKSKEVEPKKMDSANGWDMFKRDKKKKTRGGKSRGISRNRWKSNIDDPLKNSVEVQKPVNKVSTIEKVIENVKSNEIINFDTRRLLIDERKAKEHEDILSNLVNCLLDLPVKQVKMQIETWISDFDGVNEIDFLSLATFLGMLPQKKRIEDLHFLLKTMHRCVTKSDSCVWHETYKKIADHIQYYMQLEYNSNLMTSPLRCDRCTK